MIDTVVGNQKPRVRFGGNLCQINAESVNFLVVFLPFWLSGGESGGVLDLMEENIAASAFCATISSGAVSPLITITLSGVVNLNP